MKHLQKIGGIAALIGAATNLFALVMLITLAPKKVSVPTTLARPWLSLRTTRLSCAFGT